MIIPFLLVLAYAIVSGIAFGLPLSGFMARSRLRRPDVSPAWEASTILLLGALGAVVAFYPQVLPLATVTLQPLWVVIAGLLLVRLVLVVADYAGGYRLKPVRWSLAVVSLALPMVLVQNVTMILAGSSNLATHLGAAAAMALTAAVMTVALWSGYYYRPGRVVREIARTSFWFGLVAATVALPLALSLDGAIAFERNIPAAWWPVYLAAGAAVGCLTLGTRRRYFAASVTLVSGLGIAVMGLVRAGLG